jgi:5'-nucleotidase
VAELPKGERLTRQTRILVTNDDGIHAPGLHVLEKVARDLSDNVFVVAPETNQSFASHSLTLQRPLWIRQVSEGRFAVDGTPTDCVLLAVQTIVKDQPIDLVLSGVNFGGNLGEDVTYSGTVAAAMEATLFDIPAIALSQVCGRERRIKWSAAEQHAPTLIRRLYRHDWAPGTLININFPDCLAKSVAGYRVTRQGKRKAGDEVLERIDPRGQPYVWIGVPQHDESYQDGTDLHAVAENCVSVTPVHLDLTHEPSFAQLERVLA